MFKSFEHPTRSLSGVHSYPSIQRFGVRETEQVVFDGPGRHLGSVEKSFGVASTNDGPTDDQFHDQRPLKFVAEKVVLVDEPMDVISRCHHCHDQEYHYQRHRRCDFERRV